MPSVKVQTVLKVGDSLAVTLPVDVCRALNIQRGDAITIGVFEENTLVMRRLTSAEINGLKPQQVIYGTNK